MEVAHLAIASGDPIDGIGGRQDGQEVGMGRLILILVLLLAAIGRCCCRRRCRCRRRCLLEAQGIGQGLLAVRLQFAAACFMMLSLPSTGSPHTLQWYLRMVRLIEGSWKTEQWVR